MKYKPLPPLEELREYLDYNPDTGILTWKRQKGLVKKGQEAGTVNTEGYRIISFKFKKYRCNRIAYYMHYGVDPLAIDVDHKNGNKLDQSLTNLRLATNQENSFNQGLSKNNTSGVKGVSWNNRDQRWVAMIGYNRKNINLGYYINKEDAIQARREAEIKYYGEFRRQD
jgi:hypothetical protein